MISRREIAPTGKLPLTAHQRRQLLQALRSTHDAKLYQRLLAVIEVDRGRPVAQITAMLRVGRASVYLWLRRYLQHRDPAAVADRSGRGRPSGFDTALQDLLEQSLAQPPLTWGYDATGWTIPLLCEHLGRLTDRVLSPRTLRRYLHAHRYVFKRPRYRLEPDPDYRKKSAT